VTCITVVITLREKCESLRKFDPYIECSESVDAVLKVYKDNELSWYEEFGSLGDALDALRTAVRARSAQGEICLIIPEKFLGPNDVEAYECHKDSVVDTLLVQRIR